MRGAGIKEDATGEAGRHEALLLKFAVAKNGYGVPSPDEWDERV
jgi:hypothetical protein